MRTQFVTDDGKVFNNKETAMKHEDSLKNSDSAKAKKELIEKLKINNSKMDALNEELQKIAQENHKLIEEWYTKHATLEQREMFDKIDKFFDDLEEIL